MLYLYVFRLLTMSHAKYVEPLHIHLQLLLNVIYAFNWYPVGKYVIQKKYVSYCEVPLVTLGFISKNLFHLSARQTELTTIGDFRKYNHECQAICTLACETIEQTNKK